MAATQVPDDGMLEEIRETSHLPHVATLVHVQSGKKLALYEGVNRVGRDPGDDEAGSVRLVSLGLLKGQKFGSVHREHFDIEIESSRTRTGVRPSVTISCLPKTKVPVFLLADDGSVDTELQANHVASLRPNQAFEVPGNPRATFRVELSAHGERHLRSDHARHKNHVALAGTQEPEDDGHEHAERDSQASTQPSSEAGRPQQRAVTDHAPKAQASVKHGGVSAAADETLSPMEVAMPVQGRGSVHRSHTTTQPLPQEPEPPRTLAATLVVDDDMDLPDEHDNRTGGAVEHRMEPTQIAVYDATQVAEPMDTDDETEPTRPRGVSGRVGNAYSGRAGALSAVTVRKLADPSECASLDNAFSLPADIPLQTQLEYSPARPVHRARSMRAQIPPPPAAESASEEKHADESGNDAASEALGGEDAQLTDDDLGEDAGSAPHSETPPAVSDHAAASRAISQHNAPLARVPAAPPDTLDETADDVPISVLRARMHAADHRAMPAHSPASRLSAITGSSPHITESQMAVVNSAVDNALKAAVVPPEPATETVPEVPPATESVDRDAAPADTRPQPTAQSRARRSVAKPASAENPELSPEPAPVRARTPAQPDVPASARGSSRRRAVITPGPVDATEEPQTEPDTAAGKKRSRAQASVPTPPDATEETETNTAAGKKRGRAQASVPAPAAAAESSKEEQPEHAEPGTRKRGRPAATSKPADNAAASKPAESAPAAAEPVTAPAPSSKARKGGAAQAETSAPSARAPSPADAAGGRKRGSTAAASAAPAAAAPAAASHTRGSKAALPAGPPLEGVVVEFTGLVDDKGPHSRSRLEQIVRRLGGAVASPSDDISHITHLVAPRLLTTPKFLKAVCAVSHIVTPEWLSQCDQAKRRVPEHDFVPVADARTHAEFLETKLGEQLRSRDELPTKPLTGVKVYLLPDGEAEEKRAAVRDVITFAGGQVATNLADACNAKKRGTSVIGLAMSDSTTAKSAATKEAVAAGIQVCDRRLLSAAIFHQDLRAPDVYKFTLPGLPTMARK